jgi:hypothetical protein
MRCRSPPQQPPSCRRRRRTCHVGRARGDPFHGCGLRPASRFPRTRVTRPTAVVPRGSARGGRARSVVAYGAASSRSRGSIWSFTITPCGEVPRSLGPGPAARRSRGPARHQRRWCRGGGEDPRLWGSACSPGVPLSGILETRATMGPGTAIVKRLAAPLCRSEVPRGRTISMLRW